MSSLLTVGIVLALAGLIAYISTKLGAAKSDLGQEKATSQVLQEVAKTKIDALNEVTLKMDADTRAAERDAETETYEHETTNRTSIGFYPERLRRGPKNPDDLN